MIRGQEGRGQSPSVTQCFRMALPSCCRNNVTIIMLIMTSGPNPSELQSPATADSAAAAAAFFASRR